MFLQVLLLVRPYFGLNLRQAGRIGVRLTHLLCRLLDDVDVICEVKKFKGPLKYPGTTNPLNDVSTHFSLAEFFTNVRAHCCNRR